SETAMRRLRELKHREEKPFALMFPTLASVKLSCEISELEERLLLSSEAPIVLLRRKSSRLCNEDHRPGDFNPEFEIPPAVAPGNSYLGVMLPYTPLHHLLMHLLEFPVVATSGNLADEPICTDEHEAFERLGKIADRFLVHNRPIVRPVDDSIVRAMAGREMVLRRARGFAPLPVPAGPAQRVPEGGLQSTTPVLLAVGAHLKNSVALGIGNQVFVSQHIGDLETASAFHAFKSAVADLQRLHEVEPGVIAVDAHPDYLSTKFARMTSKVRVVEVQHHHAHVLSCMADNELDGPVLGVVWDGSGFGPDGTLWGGEFLKVSGGAFERMGHFRNFQLPGGDSAIREPRRSAAGLLFEIFGDDFPAEIRKTPGPEMFSPNELGTLATMLRKRLNAPSTSSVGRLFDAVASLVNLRQRAGFEGQAAMDLEFALEGVETEQAYPSLILTKDGPLVLDWQPMILKILADLQNGVPAGEISAKFHNGLVDVIVTVAHRAGEKRVVMTGGCFQNRYLTERAVRRLSEEGFEPVWHQRIPPNDGGIAVGQIAAVHYTIDGTSSSAASEYKR
ncbi:MAG: carbamoyltransferase HypF, partial [Verrucomicrobiota bacterium]